MDNSPLAPNIKSCGPECTCNDKPGLSLRIKLILFLIIIVGAGAVLANSLVRKSRQPVASAPLSYATALSLNSAGPAKTGSVLKSDTAKTGITFSPLSSLSSLDPVANEFDGVFILLARSEAEKTPAMAKEVADAATAIAVRGIRMGTFQLAPGTQEFDAISAQLPPPGIVVAIKGMGMRVVGGNEITQTKLVQACFAAMQPSGCCPTGSGKSCKKTL